MLTPQEVKRALGRLTLLVDTREQDTKAFRKRLDLIGFPHKRQKLDFGDYSATTALDDGTVISLSNTVCIERKMSLDELCMCFGNQRQRFVREFERAKQAHAKLYLLVEGANWENVITGRYRSKLSSAALRASLMAWLARYDCQVIFCKAETTPVLIREILYREIKEILEADDEQS